MTIAPATRSRACISYMDAYTSGGTGEGVEVILPRTYQPDGQTPLVMYAHGAGGNYLVGMSPDLAPGLYHSAHRIADAGYPVVCGDFGGVSTWANPISQTRMEACRVWAQDPAGKVRAKPGKVILMGSSMGGINCIGYYRAFPGNVYCAVRSIPVSDLDQIRTYDVNGSVALGGFRDWINGAYGLPAGSTNIYPAQVTGPAWSAGTGYVLGNLVTRLGGVYRAKGPSTGQAPESTPASWDYIRPGTSFAAIPGAGNPATHLGELANLPLLDYYASDDAIIDPATVVTLNNASLTKERHAVSGFGGHTDASVNAMDIDRVLAFIQQYAPLPIGEPT